MLRVGGCGDLSSRILRRALRRLSVACCIALLCATVGCGVRERVLLSHRARPAFAPTLLDRAESSMASLERALDKLDLFLQDTAY